MSDWPAPRNREQWKVEVRDRWIDWLNALPTGTTVLVNDSAYWTRIDPPAMPMASRNGWWGSGPNRLSTPMLLKLGDDFVVVDVDNEPQADPAPPPPVGPDRYHGELVEATTMPFRLRDTVLTLLVVYAVMLTVLYLWGVC